MNTLLMIKNDIHAAFGRDPAARSMLEIALCYPGLHAIWIYRIANHLWNSGYKLTGRVLSHFGRLITGIEIHPGATIGKGVFIDHGMGVVIGETAEIGDNVTIYHGVTLGGISWEKVKRHPTIGNNVVIGAGAKILGNIKIGDNSTVGANSVIVVEIPANSTVVGIPGRIVSGTKANQKALAYPDTSKLPDPITNAIKSILDQVHTLEKSMDALKHEPPSHPCKVCPGKEEKEESTD